LEDIYLRAVTTATAAAALGLERKAFDNMIGRLEASELPRGRQGVARRIPVSLLPRLFLAAELTDRLVIPFRDAFRLAGSLADGDQPAAPFIRIEADFDLLTTEVNHQLERAIEAVVRRPRGRPRRPGR
jgi:hypothetical protein